MVLSANIHAIDSRWNDWKSIWLFGIQKM